MSAEVIRRIVDSLNDDPFNYNINLISFDNFSNERLLQTLSDVLCWINETERIDVRNEAADQTAFRILNHLKILKFKPPADIEQLEEWRAGIAEGAKASVYPVLNYLFENVDQLKQRAYLAKFLVKVDIPPQIQDSDLHVMQEEVAQLMEQFKEVHSRAMELSGETEHVEGIKADLKAMDAEKEQITRRIERIDAKVKNIPHIDRYLEYAEMRRTEMERHAHVTETIKNDMRPWMIKAEKKIKRLEGMLEELRHAAERIDPTEMIQKLEAEIQTNSYLADEKLLHDIEQKRPIIAELNRVVQGPAIDESTIKRLQDEIDAKNESIRRMVEERERKEEGHDENFSIYRHQTATVERKKAATAQRLQDARQELEHIESQIAEKKRELRERSGGEEVVTSVQFRNYVNKMRVKTNEYKKKRRELDAISTENNVLARTTHILSERWNDLKGKIEDMGGDVTDINIEVPVMNQRPKTAAPRTDDVEELRNMVKELSMRLAAKSDELVPLRRHHSERTDEFNEIMDNLRETKRDYERRKAALESGFAAIKEEVEELENRKVKTEEKAKNAKERLIKAREQKQRLDRERRGEAKPIVQELEEAIKQAQEEYDSLEGNGGKQSDLEVARRQKAMWRGMEQLFEAKIRYMNEGDSDAAVPLGDRMRFN